MKQLEILTSKSLINLENIFIKNPDIINLSFSELVKKYNLSLTNRYEFNDKISLINPEKKDLKDRENSKMILNILPNLSPAEATDERLWVTLSLNQFKKYTLIRWPEKEHFKLHFFLKSGWRQIKTSLSEMGSFIRFLDGSDDYLTSYLKMLVFAVIVSVLGLIFWYTHLLRILTF